MVHIMIRFGIVGAGGIAQKFARDIKFANGAVATAIASRNLERAQKELLNLKMNTGLNMHLVVMKKWQRVI